MAKQDKSQSDMDRAFDRAVEAGNARKMSVRHIVWKEQQKVTGVLKSVLTGRQAENEQGYKRYIIDCGNEYVSCVCGIQVDQILGTGEYLDKLVRLEFLGQEAIGDGRRVNNFVVTVADIVPEGVV